MFLKAPHHAILAAILTIATVLPASAQGFDSAEVKRIQNGLPDIGRAYSIRVTTGATTNAGFEKALTQTDPNLKHWTWVPISSMNQAYIHVAPGQVSREQPNYQRPSSVYAASKPVRVPLPVVRRQDWKTPMLIASRSASRSTSDVSGRVSFSKAPAPRIAETRTYTYSNGDVSGRLYAPKYQAAYNDSKDVYGKLMSKIH